jgi:hypothetical protein
MRSRDALQPYVRLIACATVLAATALAPSSSTAQSAAKPLLQFEVGDSIGLPLPDTRFEVFTLLEGGIAWEWAPVDPASLGAGIWLVRFSHPGYRSTAFSVPLRDGSTVALRVRLDTLRDTVTRAGKVLARTVHGSGLAIEGRVKTDVLGRRRVIAHNDIGVSTDGTTIGAVIRRAENTDLNVVPVSGGAYLVYSRYGGGRRCTAQVMINGDRRRFLPFSAFDNLYGPSEIEAIEIFPDAGQAPYSYLPTRSPCALLVAWMKDP